MYSEVGTYCEIGSLPQLLENDPELYKVHVWDVVGEICVAMLDTYEQSDDSCILGPGHLELSSIEEGKRWTKGLVLSVFDTSKVGFLPCRP